MRHESWLGFEFRPELALQLPNADPAPFQLATPMDHKKRRINEEDSYRPAPAQAQQTEENVQEEPHQANARRAGSLRASFPRQ